MKVIIDIEGNGLADATKIWVVCLRDIDTGKLYVYRNIVEDAQERERFLNDARTVESWIGHNVLGYDVPTLVALCPGFSEIFNLDHWTDTLIISRMLDYSREGGHSLEDYGKEFGVPKSTFIDYSKYSQQLEDRCVIDTEITLKVYLKYLKYILSKDWSKSITLEHKFQYKVINSLSTNGFSFNTTKANTLLLKVTKELKVLDDQLLKEFPPKLRLIREITPKVTKYDTLSRTDFRFEKGGDLSEYNGGPFCRCEWVSFNPSSHRQIVDVLANSGWSPVDKTQTHIDTEREIARLRYARNKSDLDTRTLSGLISKLDELKKTGWKVNENNLSTLPPSAPSPARTLARRILLESRRRTLTEWLSLVRDDNRVHGEFFGIGAWTHRMAHQKPNTANIPNPTDLSGKVKLYGAEMRSLWQAPKNRLLVGVDAEGIQLRIFAHYIDDKGFTDALVNGRKADKSDPHSFNQNVLGSVCKTRAAAKRFIFALLLGAGLGKLAEILGCTEREAQTALDNLLDRYEGFGFLKSTVIPADAKRGYFVGLDGRKVRIPGDEVGYRRHLCMSGYLQNGEAVVVKNWAIKSLPLIKEVDPTSMYVDIVHDEIQIECKNDMAIALGIAKACTDAIKEVGQDLNLKCPLAGSYFNDDVNDYTIGQNWYQTH